MILEKLRISENNFRDLMEKWDQPWRFYHTQEHLNYLLDKIETYNDLSKEEKDILTEVAYFHDSIYNPWSETNEEDSVYFYQQVVTDPKSEVIQIIMDTKSRTRPTDTLSSIFWELDNSILRSDISVLLDYEKKIFKEFQFADYSLYKKGRIEFLKSCLGRFENDDNLNFLINYIENHRPKIAFYPGSFNPVHLGHIDVMEKCEEIFDKVIIGIGVNMDKDDFTNIKDVKFAIRGRQLVEYGHGVLTTTTMKELSEDADITLVRGIRNATDLDYENDKLRWMEELSGHNVKVMYIPCDSKYSYISSSSIRKLMNGGFHEEAKKFLP